MRFGQLRRESGRQPIRAADHLEHRRLLQVLRLQIQARAGLEQVVERQWCRRHTRLNAGRRRVSAAWAARVRLRLLERAFADEKRDERLAVFLGQRRVELDARRRLRQQLRRVAAQVGAHFTAAQAPAGERPCLSTGRDTPRRCR